MRIRLRIRIFELLCVVTLGLASCSKDSDNYPSLVTEFAILSTDGQGSISTLTLDDGRRYGITNTMTGYDSNVSYRMVVGYTMNADSTATLYTAEPAYLLADSTSCGRHDAVKQLIVSETSQFINLQIMTLTQGGIQTWGYIIDECEEKSDIRPHRNIHISLHHNQMDDPASYTTTVYCSIQKTNIPNYETGDTVTFEK